MTGDVAWLVLFAALCTLEVVERTTRRLLGPSALGRQLARRLPGQLLLVAAWALLGWHLFSRYTVAR